MKTKEKKLTDREREIVFVINVIIDSFNIGDVKGTGNIVGKNEITEENLKK